MKKLFKAATLGLLITFACVSASPAQIMHGQYGTVIGSWFAKSISPLPPSVTTVGTFEGYSVSVTNKRGLPIDLYQCAAQSPSSQKHQQSCIPFIVNNATFRNLLMPNETGNARVIRSISGSNNNYTITSLFIFACEHGDRVCSDNAKNGIEGGGRFPEFVLWVYKNGSVCNIADCS